MEVNSSQLFFIVGSTATGKTELSIRACELLLNQESVGEVLNCDSVQVYERANIGTAKPSYEELSRAPHHLLSHVRAPEKYTAGQYRRDALEILQQRFDSEVSAMFVTGGTGFYFLALEKGMFDVPEIPLDIRTDIKQMEERGLLLELYRELCEKDPVYGRKIGEKDSYRIQRAVELIRTMDKTMEEIKEEFREQPLPWPITKVGLRIDRDILRLRVRERVKNMLSQGLVEEVESLRELGLSQWAPMLSVGYKETQAYLSGKGTYDDLLEEIVKNTMNLAKRQATWFKRDKSIRWFDSVTEMEKALDYIREKLL